jgi:hypothetical protein
MRADATPDQQLDPVQPRASLNAAHRLILGCMCADIKGNSSRGSANGDAQFGFSHAERLRAVIPFRRSSVL